MYPDEEEISRTEELGDIFDQANAAEDEDAPTMDVDEEASAASLEAGDEAAEDLSDASETSEAAPSVDDERSRDELGRFTAAPVEGEILPAAPEVSVTPLAAPMELTEELAAQWAGMDVGLQQEIINQASQLYQSATEATTRLSAYDPIAQAIEPMRQTLQMQGMTEGQYIQSLVAADHMLRTQPQQALRWIMQNYGIQPDSLSAEDDYGEDVDPAMASMLQEMQQLRSTVSNLQNAGQQQETSAAQQAVNEFSVGKPFFEEVRQTMSAFITTGAAQDLETAYDMAIHANPVTRAAAQAETMKKSEEARKAATIAKAEKAKAIEAENLSTTGTAGGDAPQKFENRTDELNSIYDSIQGAA